MFKHKHYVPFLKAKRGECWALEHLSAQARKVVTPLFDVLPHNKNALSQHATTVCGLLRDSWGGAERIFLDPLHCGVMHPGAGQVGARVFAAARQAQLAFVPVTGLARHASYQTAVAHAVTADHRGAVLRLTTEDFVNTQQLIAGVQALLQAIQIGAGDCDLVIDYGRQDNYANLVGFLRMHLGQIPNLLQWRTLTVGAGSMPPSIGNLAVNQWHQVQRHAWRGWSAAITGQPTLPRKPSYGDYGVRDPGLPPDFGAASPNLRYTADGYVLVRHGTSVKTGGSQQIHAICQSLVQRPEFSGASFSEGDSEIQARVAPQSSSGGGQQWTQWCMNHHFEFVAQQLAAHV